MKDFSDIQKLVATDLQKTDDKLKEHLKSNVSLINQISSHIIQAGGKRLRPLLLLLSANAHNYKGNNHYLMAVVIELIHTATLIHDDIVDESVTRRGKYVANKIWSNAASVLAGDFIYSRAFEMMVKADSMYIMQILSKTTNNIAEGEVLQLLRCKNSQISEKEYYQVIKLKTAYLFKASTQIGAVLSKANKNQELAITNYGMYLGNAFQIMDDLLDYESDYKITGKKIGNDLAEGKATIPIIYALNNTSGVENKFLKDSIENADNSNIEKVVEILHSVKAFDYTRQKTQKFSKLAKECLVNLEESDYKQALILLCDLLLERKS